MSFLRKGSTVGQDAVGSIVGIYLSTEEERIIWNILDSTECREIASRCLFCLLIKQISWYSSTTYISTNR